MRSYPLESASIRGRAPAEGPEDERSHGDNSKGKSVTRARSKRDERENPDLNPSFAPHKIATFGTFGSCPNLPMSASITPTQQRRPGLLGVGWDFSEHHGKKYYFNTITNATPQWVRPSIEDREVGVGSFDPRGSEETPATSPPTPGHRAPPFSEVSGRY